MIKLGLNQVNQFVLTQKTLLHCIYCGMPNELTFSSLADTQGLIYNATTGQFENKQIDHVTLSNINNFISSKKRKWYMWSRFKFINSIVKITKYINQ